MGDSNDLPEQSTPYWMTSTPETAFDTLDEDVKVDVAVVGAGITGVSTAASLADHDLSVALVEADRVATAVTGHTTAKLTSLHGLIYDYLINQFGEDQARLYAEANEAAIQTVSDRIAQQDINCDFTESNAYTYAVDDTDQQMIEDEVDAAQRLGLPATYTEDVPAPVNATAAVKFAEQAHFHPRKYLLALVETFAEAEEHYVFEQSRVRDLDPGSPHRLRTDGGEIASDSVVITTQFPFHDTGMYFARMYPKYSYVMGVYLNESVPEGMYYSTEETFHSFRPQPTEDGTMLLVGGQPHQTGEGDDTVDRYRKVARFVQEQFDVDEIRYRWATQDYTTMDRVPYIGRLSPVADSVYVATGFRGWGMTHGTVAGMLLTDLITSEENTWHELYTPNRVGPPRAWKKFVAENVENAKRFVKGRRDMPSVDQFPQVRPGESKHIMVDGERIAAYRDRDGELHVVSAVCTHMGCVVSWNAAEETWDCPCHGSRFDHDGSVIGGPAQDNLPEKDVSDTHMQDS